MTNTNQNVEIKLNGDIDIDTIKRYYKNYIEYTKKYFDELPLFWYLILIVAIIVAIATLVNGAVFASFVAIVIACLIGWLIGNFKQNQVDDKTFDNILKNIKKKVEHDAVNVLGLADTDFIRTPVTLDAPRYENRAGASLSYKVGKDGKLRYSLHNIHIFFFTEKYLAMYGCALDLKTGSVLNEQTEEFFYKDVVSVSVKTASTTDTFETNWTEDLTMLATGVTNTTTYSQRDTWKSFELRNAGGGCIRVPLRREGDNLDIENPDAVVNSIRALLRDIK